MPVEPSLISFAIQAAGTATGPVWPRFTTAVAIGVASWMINPQNFLLTGVATGTIGSGTVTGKFTVVPNVALVHSQITSVRLTGLDVSDLARAVAIGVGSSISATAMYQGVASGVGTGSDVSLVTLSNATTLVQSLQVAFSSVGYTGANISSLCVGMGTGIALMLQTGTGIGVVVGASGPSPGAGTSTSWIV